MLSKCILAALALISMVELACATETARCKPEVAELVQSESSCKSSDDPTQVMGVKALYANVDQADVLLMRINDRGAPVSAVVAIIVFLPAVTILFFSWLVKSSK
jgi:hypothetical protein